MGLRRILKRVLTVLCMVLVSPLALFARLEGAAGNSEVFFGGAGEILSLIPTLLGNHLRLAYYLMTLQSCRLDVCFEFGSRVSHRTARIGTDVTIGGYTALGTVTVADHVLIGPRVSVLSGGRQHEVWDDDQNVNDQRPRYERVHIGTNTWIGEGAIIMADIGERCIVSAGSVVTRPVPDHRLATGNPARAMARDWQQPEPSEPPVGSA
jgi:virginiamycin A acetyltransferase